MRSTSTRGDVLEHAGIVGTGRRAGKAIGSQRRGGEIVGADADRFFRAGSATLSVERQSVSTSKSHSASHGPPLGAYRSLPSPIETTVLNP
jgi:hypothetical protein